MQGTRETWRETGKKTDTRQGSETAGGGAGKIQEDEDRTKVLEKVGGEPCVDCDLPAID